MAQSHHADIQFLIILKLIRESLYLFVYFLEGGGGGVLPCSLEKSNTTPPLRPFIKAGAVKHKKNRK